MNHLLLYLLGQSLNRELKGHKIGQARMLRPLLVVPVGPGGQSLVIVLTSPGPFCYVAGSNPLGGVGEPAFKRIRGRTIEAVATDRDERALRLTLSGGTREEALAVYTYGSTARVRVESEGTIIESLDVNETGVTLDGPSKGPRSLDMSALDPFGESVPVFLAGEGRRAEPVVGRGDAGPFTDAAAACEHIAADMVGTAQAQIIERASAIVQRTIDKKNKLREQLDAELERAQDFESVRNEANILAAYQSQIRAGSDSVRLPDLYSPGDEVTIDLDPAMSIEEQVQRRFKKASKLERAREALAKRIQQTAREAESLTIALDDAIGAMDFADTYERIDKVIGDHGLRKVKRGAARGGVGERTYRQFELSSEWFAIVGRNDKENDEITFRVAKPDDIWMHAQQTAGSHVVLRARGAGGNPPEKVLEAAAAIAAHFSKAKHSSLVPVIYTLRKYVRKFRGAKPGEVTCEREKTIFVEPALPPAEAR